MYSEKRFWQNVGSLNCFLDNRASLGYSVPMTKHARLAMGIAAMLGALIIGAGVLHTNGYVLTNSGVYQGATLTVTDVPAGTTVFIQNKERGTVPEDAKELTVHGIGPGEKDVIVSYPTAWPWVSRFNFATQTTYALNPVLVPRQPDRLVITPTMEGWQTALQTFARTTLPSATNPLASSDGTALLWTDGNTVYARAGGQAITTFSGTNQVRSLAWFLDRNDAVIIATDTQVFVIGIYPEAPQNFLPIYSGTAPVFGLDGTNDRRIYIKDTASSQNILLLSLGL